MWETEIMHKWAGIGIVDEEKHSLDFQIAKWEEKGKTWFSIYIPCCEREEFVIPIGQEKDIAQSLRQMADILDNKDE